MKRLLSHTTLVKLLLSLIFLQGCKNDQIKSVKAVDFVPLASSLDSVASKLSKDIESFTELSLSINALPKSSYDDPSHTMLVKAVGGSLTRLNIFRDSIMSYKSQIVQTKNSHDASLILNEVALSNIAAVQSKLNMAQEQTKIFDEVYVKLSRIYKELNSKEVK